LQPRVGEDEQVTAGAGNLVAIPPMVVHGFRNRSDADVKYLNLHTPGCGFIPYMRGMVAMARTDDPNSANSQFFIMFSPNIQLWGKYTVIGRVMSGMDAVDKIAVGEPPANPTTIVSARLGDATVVQAPAAAPVPAAAPPVEAPATPAGG